MDCPKCAKYIDRTMNWGSGEVSIIMWCLKFKGPCSTMWNRCKMIKEGIENG